MSALGQEELEQAVCKSVKYCINEYDMEFGELLTVLTRVQTSLMN